MGTGEETIAAGTLLRRIGAPSDIAGGAYMLASFDLYFMLPSYHPSRRGALPRAEVALMLPIYHPSRRGALPRLGGRRVGHGDHPQPRRRQPALTDLELVATTNMRDSAAYQRRHRSCPCSCTARSCVSCAAARAPWVAGCEDIWAGDLPPRSCLCCLCDKLAGHG